MVCVVYLTVFSSSYHLHHQVSEKETKDSSQQLCVNTCFMIASYTSAGCNCVVCCGDICTSWLQLCNIEIVREVAVFSPSVSIGMLVFHTVRVNRLKRMKLFNKIECDILIYGKEIGQ